MTDRNIEATARVLLDMSPDPVPRVRILEDLLKVPPEDPEVINAKQEAEESRWIEQLRQEQLSHGGWPRFHSRDSKAKTNVPTTEYAVHRAIELGLNRSDPLLSSVTHYAEQLLSNKLAFPDRPEANDRWSAGKELFVAATLAEIDPDNRLLEPIYDKWSQIVERTFETGQYDDNSEWQAHCDLTGAQSMRNSYLVMNNRYSVGLIAHCQEKLTEASAANYFRWLHGGSGLGYIDVPPGVALTDLADQKITGWFATHLLLSRFPYWRGSATPEQLWRCRNSEGLWDFGKTTGLRLSDNWLKRKDRVIDHSIAALQLLRAE